jgi:hypothetical protein
MKQTISSGEQRRRQKAIRTAVRSTQLEGHSMSAGLELDLRMWAEGNASLDRVYARLLQTYRHEEARHA